MEFVEYMRELMNKIKEEKGACRVKMGDDEFMLHEECHCDFQKDFVIMYDNATDVSLVVKYDAIETLQYMPQDKLDELQDKALSELKHDLFEKLMKD